MKLPSDAFILLSYLNTKLRDGYASLEELCEDCGCSAEEVRGRMSEIGYAYDRAENAFKEV